MTFSLEEQERILYDNLKNCAVKCLEHVRSCRECRYDPEDPDHEVKPTIGRDGLPIFYENCEASEPLFQHYGLAKRAWREFMQREK